MGNTIKVISDPKVEDVFADYPEVIKPKMLFLRKLIIETAEEIEDIDKLEETLKWGEPSYLTKNGSTLRIDWKEKKPDQYAMYFKCTSKLVPTFQLVFGDSFSYETTRAIVFKLDEKLPIDDLKKCITMTLQYHKVKNLPLLGAK